MSSSYQSAFRQALLELERLLTQKDGLERRISDLKTALPLLAKLARSSKQEQATMAELISAAETGSISLTRAVRLALAMAQKPLTTVEIRDRLVERGFEFSSYSNPMAAIPSAVNRMMAVAEITAATEGRGPGPCGEGQGVEEGDGPSCRQVRRKPVIEVVMKESEQARRAYAAEIRATANIRSHALIEAFAHVPREQFLGPGPWKVIFADPEKAGALNYRNTETANPEEIYHNVLVAIDAERQLNNGQPTALAVWADCLDLQPGMKVFHLGCGTGYYTAIIAHTVGACVGHYSGPTPPTGARRQLVVYVFFPH